MSLGSTRSIPAAVMPEPETESVEYTQEELESMTKAQIAELAAELGYEGVTTNLTKAQMIEAFLAAQGQGGDDR